MMLRRFVTFGGVGIIATLIQYLILVALVATFGIPPALASTVGYVSTMAFGYLVNYRVTFASEKAHSETSAKYISVLLGGLAVNGVLMSVGTAIGLNYIIAQIAATGVVFCFNFLGNELWTFRKKTHS